MAESDKDKITELLTRGVDSVIGCEDLTKRLQDGETLTIKLGIDPTSPNLHLGRAVTLLKLRDFQRLGHKIVFIVGDFTGVIGDTSDKESERPMLSSEVIEENKKTYFVQMGKLLDLDKIECRYNSEWLGTLTYKEIGEHADKFSVADFIARDNIKKRIDAGKRVSLREVLYPLMQGYDSVAVDADVEVGGTDQRFNMLAGRTLQASHGKRPQSIIMNPLILGLDGRKMSSSWGNTINLTDEPQDMFGKVMSLRDEMLVDYFTLCTRVSMNEVTDIEQGLSDASLHPRDAKLRLASEIVTMYHGEEDAMKAEQEFSNVFSAGALPKDMLEIDAEKGVLVVELLIEAKLVESKSDWRRLVEGGGVRSIKDDSDERIADIQIKTNETMVLKIGKRRFVKIKVT